jgi:hypothetical protein
VAVVSATATRGKDRASAKCSGASCMARFSVSMLWVAAQVLLGSPPALMRSSARPSFPSHIARYSSALPNGTTAANASPSYESPIPIVRAVVTLPQSATYRRSRLQRPDHRLWNTLKSTGTLRR